MTWLKLLLSCMILSAGMSGYPGSAENSECSGCSAVHDHARLSNDADRMLKDCIASGMSKGWDESVASNHGDACGRSIIRGASSQQNDLFSLVRDSFRVNDADRVLVDELKNIYVIRGNVFIKYNENFEKLNEYARFSAGAITSADVSNSMRLLLYYSHFNQVVFLDNKLSELRSPLLMDDIGLTETSGACVSASGGFWTFDAYHQKLVYIDEHFQKKHESLSMDKFVHYSNPPDGMMEQSNRVFLHFKDAGLLVFNQFGNFVKKIPVLSANDFQVSPPFLYYATEKSLKQFHMVTMEENTIFSGKKININNFDLIKNQLYIFDKNRAMIFKVIK